MSEACRILASMATARGLRVGIFGGSFNPAHEGHCHIADIAKKSLHLDQVWWLVSPQNPFKTSDEMPALDIRYQNAVRMAARCHYAKFMHVSRLESALSARATATTIKTIKRAAPTLHLVWIMGADNMGQFHRWHRVTEITRNAAIAVINRPGYRAAALSSPMAQRLTRMKPHMMARRRSGSEWCFINDRLNSHSATAIRDSGVHNNAA